MNIYFLKGFDATPQVDADAIKRRFTDIRRVAGVLDVAFDARLDKGVRSLHLAAINAEQELRGQLVAIIAGKGGAGLDTLQAKLKSIEAAGLPEELRQKAIDLTWTSVLSVVGQQRAKFDHAAMVIREACSTFEAINFTLRVTELTPELGMQTNLSTKKLEDDSAALALLRKDRETLDATIKSLEKSKWPTIKLPSPEELKALSLPSPELAAIEAGLELLEKLLGKVTEGMAYIELTGERDRLRNRQAQAVIDIDALKALLVELSRQQSCLETAAHLHVQKDELKDQLLHVAQPLQQYSLTLMAAGQARDLDAIISILNACHSFADSTYSGIS
ncbi:alpha-xenorhabdolysin family binary toxin subunit B [Pseudomonas putida]